MSPRLKGAWAAYNAHSDDAAFTVLCDAWVAEHGNIDGLIEELEHQAQLLKAEAAEVHAYRRVKFTRPANDEVAA